MWRSKATLQSSPLVAYRPRSHSFKQLTVPLLIFPITVPIILSAIVSTKRLERFSQRTDASLDYYEVQGKSGQDTTISESGSGDSGLGFGGDKFRVQRENKLNERLTLKLHIPESPAPLAHSEPQRHSYRPYVVIRPRKFPGSAPAQAHAQLTPAQQLAHRRMDSWSRDSLVLKLPEDMAVSVRDASFSWCSQGAETRLLTVRNVTVPRGKLTMVVGKNGSGKTSLLSALLMECLCCVAISFGIRGFGIVQMKQLPELAL
ncbi:unnamed protein product [Ceratitis capitata]|uniref:(Mediterranean fruit fly) hypothetical protein n=1 Tax=Ceratitis capitata TaxID=7213 RepID=A0A811UHQ5_CERCA|nr:unnamed protein product [Ceratitis capitata]